ncbi:unnamed protein product, partial [marine sediment metagenome]
LAFAFDYQDDEQDRQRAEIRNIRSEGTERNINTGALNTRVSREQMMDNGDVTKVQFERLELEDGRLLDGTSVLTLFYKTDPAYEKYLSVGISDPLNVFAYEPIAISEVIIEQMREVAKAIANEDNPAEREVAIQCMFALLALQKLYEDPLSDIIATAFSVGSEDEVIEEEEPFGEEGEEGDDPDAAPRKKPASRKRGQLQSNPQESNSTRGRNGLRPSPEDR